MPLIIEKEKNSIKIVGDGTNKYISTTDLAKVLKTTLTILQPRIDVAPNAPVSTIDGAAYISELKLPGFLSFLTKPPTPEAVASESAKALRSLRQNNFSLYVLLDLGAYLAPAATNSGSSTPAPVVVNSAPYVPPITEFESIFGDLKNLAFQDGLITCRQYWPGAAATGGAGGIFKAVSGATLIVDNVKVFAGNGCRWVRQDCETITAEHAGCLKGSIRPWRVYLAPQTQFAPIALLSDKFASLAAAQAWYPGARLANPAKAQRAGSQAVADTDAFAADINSVALQHALTQYSVKAAVGVYRIQKPIEYFSFMNLQGDGGDSSQTVFVVENQNLSPADRQLCHPRRTLTSCPRTSGIKRVWW
jgi:hypothetical protein